MKGLTLPPVPKEIQIEVSGGFGITAEIYNNGETNLSNLEWSMVFDGPIVMQKGNEGVITSLPADGKVDIHTRFVLGLGPAHLTITVGAFAKECEVILIGPFVLIQ